MGFAIAFGILVAASAMATFFTPVLTALLGHAAWWTGHGDEPAEVTGDPAEASDEHARTVRAEPAGRLR